jgi:PAS domain S-box-containing protein
MNGEQTDITEDQSRVMEKVTIKVLLVDDDKVDRLLAKNILRSSQQVKFAIESADSVSIAVDRLNKDEYDVILLDLGLPDSRGIETVSKIRKVSTNIPIVVLTGHSDELVGIEAIKNGATDYLVKGVALENLLIRTIFYAIERKKAEEKIKFIAQQWKTTFDSITDMISIHDAEFKILGVNKAFADAFNAEPKELIGKTCYEVLHNTKQPCPNCPHMWTFKTRKPSTIEIFEPRLGYHLGISTSPVFDENDEVIRSVHVVKNITERKLAEENIIKANEKLKEYNKLKDEFISTTSHELRTPLSIIQGAIRLVLDEIPGKIVEAQRDVLTKAMNSVKRLTKIVNSLLTIAKIESGKMDLQKTLVNVCSLVKDTVSEYKLLAEEKDLSLEYEVPEHDIDACLDPDKMRQILINLISNSIKFTPERGWIRVACIEKDDQIRFIIQDSGVGIAKEDLPKLFDKFTQFGRKYGPEEKGTGLGLAIVKKLVGMHEGRIDVESEVGQGTTFTIFLPLGVEAGVENLPEEVDEHVETTLCNEELS